MNYDTAHIPTAGDSPVPLSRLLAAAGGSVRGRDHALAGSDCQDAYAVVCGPECVLGVVTDGCGSARHSSAGAQIGARLVLAALGRSLRKADYRPADSAAQILAQTLQDVLGCLQELAARMSPAEDIRETVAEHFLFTTLGFAVTPETAMIFGLGDGLYAINGQIRELGPYPGNAPPYLAYGLLGRRQEFELHALLPAEQLESLLIGSDGAAELLKMAEAKVPGRDEAAGGLEPFWLQPRYTQNPDAIRRRLAVLNRQTQTPDWNARTMRREHGLLRDDTTLVVVQRRQAAP